MKNYFIHIKKPTVELEDYQFIFLDKIEKKLKISSIDNIYIHDLLDYLNPNIVIEILKLIKSKLKKHGKLYIQGIDVKSLSSSLLYGQINLSTFRSMIYGIDFDKQSIYSIGEIKNIIHDLDLRIDRIQFINGSQYYIECNKYE